jgi:chemotaxis protein CheX
MIIMEAIDQQVLARVVQASAADVFSTMLGLSISPGEHYLEKMPPSPADGVVSLIGLAGQWAGTGCISCSGQVACTLASKMLMLPFDAVGEDVLDVVAELTNMVIGNVKTGLEEFLGPMGLSIPTVVYGKNFAARSAGEGEWTVYPFRVGEDGFEVKMFLAPNRRASIPIRPGFQNTCSLQG